MADLFLGEDVDPATHQRVGTKVAVPAAELTTHGVIVGMTGSGKTGLGIVLIEEALAAGVPTLLIDPKGDLTNLCLTFPDLSPGDFQPWVNEGDAQKAGVSVPDFAAQQAQAWKDGLAGWGLGTAQIAALRAKVDFTIYTPGSTSGVPLDIVGSLQAPASTADLETMRDEIEGYVSGLLGLVGIDADPLSSREHILLSNLIETSWSAGTSLDLATLVGQVQQPPIRKLGVFELDTFFPPKDRTALAMRLNGLLASPSFAAWAEGTPLDIESMLHTADGRPRCAIVTTAHLGDEERQFVTTLVLGKLVTWMRRQSGTTDLRALLYMDEVAGYVPPTANPPTKKPIMLLMKQARAFGLGVVLSTQNPVDLDYKSISNAGTWMVGRLQTDRDKARLLEGMSAAAGGVDVNAIGDTIGALGKREFVLRRAGKDQPEVFTTRWAMSYLRGPLTRDQIAMLMAGVQPSATSAAPATAPAAATPAAPTAAPTAAATPSAVQADAASAAPGAIAVPELGGDETVVMPEIAGSVGVRYVDVAAPWLASIGGDPAGTRLEAAIVARVRLRYDDEKADLVQDEEYEAVLFPLDSTVDVTRIQSVDYDDRDLRPDPPASPVYRVIGAPVKQATFWTRLQRDLVDHLVRSRTLEIFVNRDLKTYSRPGETNEQFAERCNAIADQLGDQEAAKLRDKYETKAKRVRDQLAAAEGRADVLDKEQKGRSSSEVMSTAGSIIGGLLKGRSRKNLGSMIGSLGTAAGRRGRTSAGGARLDAAQAKVAQLEQDAADLEAEAQADIGRINAEWDAKAATITTSQVTLERTDVSVAQIVLAWVPVP